MRISRSLMAWGMVLAFCTAAGAQNQLGVSLNDIEVAPHWIYDDLPRAMAEAKASGKPLMVVLRCVPCPPGRTLDKLVMQPDADLEAIEKQFVCVRVIQTEGLDLKRFQYDYDMSWNAMFLNADGAIYGRYGTRNASGASSDALISASGFRKAAERALALHRAYPANKDQLAAKTGPDPEYRVPEEIPGLDERAKGATTKQTCIHCHMIKEFAMRAKWQEGRLSPKDLWVYPMPERVGLTLDVDDGLLVTSVAADSPAAQAGLAAGDELVSLAAQPLISMADVQWALHTSPNEASLPVVFRRAGQGREGAIVVSGDWKKSDIAWRASSWHGLRQGLKLEPATEAEITSRGLGANSLALTIKGLFGVGGAKLKEAGLQVGDVIVAVDGKTASMSESDFLAYLRLEHGPNDSVRLDLARGGDRRQATVPMW